MNTFSKLYCPSFPVRKSKVSSLLINPIVTFEIGSPFSEVTCPAMTAAF